MLAEDVRSFLAAHPVASGQRTVDQIVERLGINVALADRLRADVSRRHWRPARLAWPPAEPPTRCRADEPGGGGDHLRPHLRRRAPRQDHDRHARHGEPPPPLPVWLGAASAFIIHAGLAAGAGRLLLLLPHRAVEAVVAALFTVGAAYLLFKNEDTEERKGEEDAAKADRFTRIMAGAFVVIFVGEFGDLTQILTANLSAHYRLPWSVFTGAALGLLTVAAVGVLSGRALVRVLPLNMIRKGAGVRPGRVRRLQRRERSARMTP